MNEDSTTPVAVVTGASRGAGKGIAVALGSRAYTVYISGRSQREGDAALPGTIFATAQAVDAAGGRGIAVPCDHRDDDSVRDLFHRVEAEQGRLDVLVNNATALHDELIRPGPFWEKSLDLVDILEVGLRSAYVASYLAAPLLLANGRGLIVNTSSFGARCYMHGPAYGAQKAGLDKMAWDMAHDLRPHEVAAVSIWMGMLRTERSERAINADPAKYAGLQEMLESPQLTGLVIDALYRDAAMMAKSGATWIGAELAAEYGILDTDGRQAVSHRAMLGEPIEWHPAVVE